MNKKGKLSSLLFIGLITISLLSLLMMDYQVRRANDITGAYSVSGAAAYTSENLLAGAIILGAVIFVLATFVIAKIRKSRLVSTMPLSKINDEIKHIEERLKGH
jgi:hypothetical protein